MTPDWDGDAWNSTDPSGGYVVLEDPMDELQCESCQ